MANGGTVVDKPSATPARDEPLAIVGIGCRYPGASGPREFWELLRRGGDATSEVPADRFDIDALYGPDTPGKARTRRGGFLQSIDRFDSYFFGISPREAEQMDPQQRLLLEVAWESLEDAGQLPDRLSGARTGVFVGICASDYNALQLFRTDRAGLNLYSLTGGTYSVLSGRVSHALGLNGPSVTLDTACSSSLVATHLAIQAVRSGDCDLALAAGVNLVVAPELSICFSQARMLAPDGRCKAFASGADGFVRSDGVGVIVLKPLSRARADGDHIYAVVLGGAVNNDGQSESMMMPDRQGQEQVLRAAYRKVGIRPADVQYVEAHGTGTVVGDPVEAGALGAVLGEDRAPDRPCYIGSVKTNIGHAEAAAGVAGLIKLALSLEHRQIPPSLHCEQPNPAIAWNDLRLSVPRKLLAWPAGPGPARAGISSFGLSGTNAHLVLEEASPLETPAAIEAGDDTRPYLLPLSAHTPEALAELLRAYRAFLSGEDGDLPPLADVCATAATRRVHQHHRAALVGRTAGELCEKLDAELVAIDGGAAARPPAGKLVWVFSGQGSQWLGMGRQLLASEPAFREELERCDRAFDAFVEWSLLEQLAAAPERSLLEEVDVIQPAIFAIQVALAALWRSWGVVPDAVVGQSMGEVAAAYVAGALSLDDAARVICRRSQLVKTTSGRGAMAVVGLSLGDARRLLRDREREVSIAVSSSPTSTVLSGDPATLKTILERLDREEIFSRWINVDYASHGPQMDPLREPLLASLEPLRPRASATPLYSTVTGGVLGGEALDAAYWFRNLREPVLFSPIVELLLEDGHGVFLELSPHPVLLSAVQQNLVHLGHDGALIASLQREQDERRAMFEALGQLHAAGRTIDWSALHGAGRRCVALPRYPWQPERFWLTELEPQRIAAGAGPARAGAVPTSSHPLLGAHLRSSVHPGTEYWEVDLASDAAAYIADHRVRSSAVVPAAAYLELALAALAEAFDGETREIADVRFEQALLLPESGAPPVQLVLSAEPGGATFRVLSARDAGGSARPVWTAHASGKIRGASGAPDRAPALPAIADVQARCADGSTEVHYAAMAARTLNYGPAFRGVERVWRRDGEALVRLRLPQELRSTGYRIHPALLDAGFQALVAALPAGAERARETWLPVGLERFRVLGNPGDAVWSYARTGSASAEDGDRREGEIFLLDQDGAVLLEASSMDLQRLGRQDAGRETADWFYEIAWRRDRLAERPAAAAAEADAPWLIVGDGNGVAAALASRLEQRGERSIVVAPGASYAADGPGRYRVDVRQPRDFERLLAEVCGPAEPRLRGVVHLERVEEGPASGTTVAELEEHEVRGCGGVLHLVQALIAAGFREPPRLFLVTHGAQPIGIENGSLPLVQSALWGLARVIANEHPELRCTAVDLGPRAAGEELDALLRELEAGGPENQVALRGGERFVARLVAGELDGAERRVELPGDRPFRLEASAAGVLDGLRLRSTRRRAPGPGEVEIRVEAAGLNFSDVMKALGIYPGVGPGPAPLGLECAGRICAVGPGVERFRVGDDVLALGYFCLGSYVTTSAELVAPKPARLGFVEAATIPVAFMTAWYGLEHLARISAGERVLIHSASGGVGLAAIQLARRAGAEIFATAGTEERREFLRSLGLEHVMDSRSLEFADEVLAQTAGQGVDIVLNSLAGEGLTRSLATLRSYGRFVELGKRDIYENNPLGLGAFKNNLSFLAVDLDHTLTHRPALAGAMLRECVKLLDSGELDPLPHRSFAASAAADAFHHMRQGKHVGKILLAFDKPQVTVTLSADTPPLVEDATYVVTGGLGGLGLSVAEWMLANGARNLVLVGRSAPGEAAQRLVDSWSVNGTRVVTARANVASEQEVARLFSEIDGSMPAVRGVVHAAGVLDDGVLAQQDVERFKRVMAPKISGAWNLHRQTLDRELDFFVLFSSAAALVGSPGQANYSAANAALDALAHYRRRLGLPALSINWGPWSGVGLAAAQANRGDRLVARGLGSITPAQGVQVLGRLLHEDRAQIGVMPFDYAQWCRFYPSAAQWPLLAELAPGEASAPAGAGGKAGGASFRDTILALDPRRRRKSLESHIREQVGQVLRIPAARIDASRPLGSYGLDSLMAVELRTRLQASLGLTLSTAIVFNHPSTSALAAHLAEKLGADPRSDSEDRPRDPAAGDGNIAEIFGEAARLSEEQLRRIAERSTTPEKHT